MNTSLSAITEKNRLTSGDWQQAALDALSEGGLREGIEWLQAIPKAKDTSCEKIGIGLKDGVPVAMELRDSFGQISLLTFTKFEKNPSLPANQFHFALPKGADVLQQ